jgi:hypothetical protein
LLFDYCLFYSGAFYTFSWGGAFCFYIAWGEMGGRRDQRRRGRRMKKSALFATIVFFGACWLKRARRKSKGKGWIGLFS